MSTANSFLSLISWPLQAWSWCCCLLPTADLGSWAEVKTKQRFGHACLHASFYRLICDDAFSCAILRHRGIAVVLSVAKCPFFKDQDNRPSGMSMSSKSMQQQPHGHEHGAAAHEHVHGAAAQHEHEHGHVGLLVQQVFVLMSPDVSLSYRA